MITARTQAPVLAWLLAALTCLLTGLAIVESRRETVALTQWEGTRLPVGEIATDEGTVQPTAASESTPRSEDIGILAPLFEDAPVPPSTDPGVLRVARLTVPPGVALPPEVATGPTALHVESGSLSVRIDGEVWVDLGLEGAQTDSVLRPGERLIIAAGAHHAIRNDGSTPAVALVVAIIPVEAATPMLGPGEPPPRGTH